MRRTIQICSQQRMAHGLLRRRLCAKPSRWALWSRLTGRYASIGNDLKHGYDIAVERINADGGIQVGNRRFPLELMVLDDESDATKTVARLRDPCSPRSARLFGRGRL